MFHQYTQQWRTLVATMLLLMHGFILPVVQGQQSIWDLIFAPILNIFARDTCDSIESIFTAPVTETFDCSCSATFSFLDGLETSIFCALDEPLCLLPPATFCGSVSFEAVRARRTGITSGEACLSFESGIPGLGDLVNIPDLCVEGETDPDFLRFTSCQVSVGGKACSSCNVCDSGVDVTFDCRNVNINPIAIGGIVIPGPNVPFCVGIGLIPGLGVEANSVRPFGVSD